MGQYRVRDLFVWPTLISLLRLPLAVGFWLLAEEPWLAMSLLVLGAATDVVDGWIARRYGMVTPLGAVVDGIADKVFAAAVVLTLIVHTRLSIPQGILLALREVGEAPLVLLWAVHRERRRARTETAIANRVGKAATVVQFAAVMAALWSHPATNSLVMAAATVGAAAALSYWRRELTAPSKRPRSGRAGAPRLR